jgi:hypothetical protein
LLSVGDFHVQATDDVGDLHDSHNSQLAQTIGSVGRTESRLSAWDPGIGRSWAWRAEC